MKIKFNNGKISTARGDVGILFVDAGLAQEVFDVVAPAVKRPTDWHVGVVAATGHPYIQAVCSNEPCASQKNVHRAQGPTAHTLPYPHCGIPGGEICPPEIAEQYQRLRKSPAVKKATQVSNYKPEVE